MNVSKTEIETEEVEDKTLDLSNQLSKNKKSNFLNQGLILIIVLLLVIVGYQVYNQLLGSFEKSTTELKQNIVDLQTKIDELQKKSEELNIFGNGIYYCFSPESTFDSIEFISPNVIRAYSFAVPDTFWSATNNYFRIEKIGVNKFTITGDVILDDTFGDLSYSTLKSSWGSSDIFKVIEISEDHKTLYYGSQRDTSYCYRNERPQ
jgi:hypothetical protein